MLPGYDKKLAAQLRKLSKAFEERDPYVLPSSHRGEGFDDKPKLTGIIQVGKRVVSIRRVIAGRACEDNCLMDLVSHLGVAKGGEGLGICEGKVDTMKPWDGIGYPCHVRNVCTFGDKPVMDWMYDFDLWNPRWTDELPPLTMRDGGHLFNNVNEHYALGRFGKNVYKIVKLLDGWLKFEKYKVIQAAVDNVWEEMELEPA